MRASRCEYFSRARRSHTATNRLTSPLPHSSAGLSDFQWFKNFVLGLNILPADSKQTNPQSTPRARTEIVGLPLSAWVVFTENETPGRTRSNDLAARRSLLSRPATAVVQQSYRGFI